MNDSNRRAANIIRTLRRRPEPKHRANTEPRHRAALTAGIAAAAIVGGGGFSWAAFTGHDAPVPVAAATVPADQAEKNYLAELRYIGITLTPEQQGRAIQIARKHVAHGHLEGMGTEMIADFKALVPGITDEKAESARLVLVHHFRAITGRQ